MATSTVSLTDTERDQLLCDILNRELVCALGCTEPIAVAYAAALARETLGVEPERLRVACSGNIIKNVKSVTVPNSGGMHGIEAAALLGAIGGDASSALEVLESVGEGDLARTRELLATPGVCEVSLAEHVPNLYIQVVAQADEHTAEVVIAEHHTNIVVRALDGVAQEGSLEAAQRCIDVGAPDSSQYGYFGRGPYQPLGSSGGQDPACKPQRRCFMPGEGTCGCGFRRPYERLLHAGGDCVRLGQPGYHGVHAGGGIRA